MTNLSAGSFWVRLGYGQERMEEGQEGRGLLLVAGEHSGIQSEVTQDGEKLVDLKYILDV